MNRLSLFAALGAFVPAMASAQGFEGAYISIETLNYSSFDEAGQMTYSGGAEVGFGTGFGASADLSIYGFDFLGGSATSATLHALYRLNPISTVGAFYGLDSYEDLDSTFYGIEGQTSFSGATIEAFFGQSEGSFADGNIYGLSGAFVFGSLGLVADYAAFDAGGDVFERYSIGGEWYLGLGPTLYAEWGQLGSDEAEDAITLGVRIGLGANGGTTFGPRSVIEIAPGF